MSYPKMKLIADVLVVFGLLWLCLAAAWLLLSQVNFAFPLLYDAVGIEENVVVYGPQNRHKNHFELTSRAEHERLFAEIVKAINDHGRGLSSLQYHGENGAVLGGFLRQAEVVHLQDVANLITTLRQFSLVCLTIIGAMLAVYGWQRWRLPSFARVAMIVVTAIAALVVAVASYGAKDLFYTLHTWVFPEDHQWFFYYQDSLMTTLMKAPVIFAPIGILILVLTLGLFLLFWFVLGRWLGEHKKIG